MASPTRRGRRRSLRQEPPRPVRGVRALRRRLSGPLSMVPELGPAAAGERVGADPVRRARPGRAHLLRGHPPGLRQRDDGGREAGSAHQPQQRHSVRDDRRLGAALRALQAPRGRAPPLPRAGGQHRCLGDRRPHRPRDRGGAPFVPAAIAGEIARMRGATLYETIGDAPWWIAAAAILLMGAVTMPWGGRLAGRSRLARLDGFLARFESRARREVGPTCDERRRSGENADRAGQPAATSCGE